MNDFEAQPGSVGYYGADDVQALIYQIGDAIARKDILAAEYALGRLQNAPDLDKLARTQLEVFERQFRDLKTGRVNDLAAVIKSLLDKQPIFERDVEVAQEAIFELEKIDPQHVSLGEWSTRIAEERRRISLEQKVPALKAEVERRLAEAEQQAAAGLYGPGLIALYDGIVQFIQGQLAQLEDPRLKTLEQKALDRREDVRLKHFILGTRALTGQFRELLVQLEGMAADDTVSIHQNPFAPEEEVRTRLTPMPVAEARRIVEKQARDKAAEKAAEYREIARNHLKEHNPEQAEKQIEDAQALYQLDSDQQTKLKAFLEGEVRPALERRNQARRKLSEAQRIANPPRKWAKLEEVEGIDPYVPGLKEEQESVKPGIKEHLESELRDVEGLLNQAPPNWKDAATKLETARSLAEHTGMSDDLQKKIARLVDETKGWRQLATEIEQAIQEAKRLATTDPVRALESLQERQAAWGERALRYEDLSKCEARIGAHANAAAVLARLAASLHSVDRQEVEQAVNAAREAADASPMRRDEFVKLGGRLQLHLDYLVGAALLQRPNRTSSDETRSLELLERVVQGQDVDWERAQATIARVKSDQTRTRERQSALEKAKSLRTGKDYKRAHELLAPYGSDPEVAPLFAQNAEEWEDALIRQVTTLFSRAPIDCTGARDLIHDLEMVGARSAQKLRAQVEGRCAEQRAAMLEKEPGYNLEEVVRIWEEALASDPENPIYRQRLRTKRKQLEYNRIQEKVDPLEKAEALQLMSKQYPGDPEVLMWHVDSLVELVSKQDEYGKLEEAAQRAVEVMQTTGQQLVVMGADASLRNRLEERQQRVASMKEIARRKHDVTLALKPDKLLDAWLRAKGEGDRLANEFRSDVNLRVWWDRTRQDAFNEAAARLQQSGGDVWRELQPAAQMLALDPDNSTAKAVLQKANRAIMDFPQELRSAQNDTTGASYPGDSEQKLSKQIEAVRELRNNMLVARDILTTFGGIFENPSDLRMQVNTYINETTALLGRLEDVRKQVNQGYAAIDQARSNNQAWYAYDQAQQRLGDLGYSQHLTVLKMEKDRQEVQEKQRYLEAKRKNLIDAVKDGRTEDALRYAQEMVGAAPGDIVARKHLWMTNSLDPRADPADEYGEQRRIDVQEPYTKQRFTTLPELVQLLLEQRTQIDQIIGWLPTVPSAQGEQVRKPILAWPAIEPQAHSLAQSGEFDEARILIRRAIDGNAQGMVGEELALDPALRWLIENSPVTEETLYSLRASQLYDYGVRLTDGIRRQRNDALRMLDKLDGWERDWKDAKQRFDALFNYLGELRQQQKGISGWLRGGSNLEAVRVQTREQFSRCMELCPKYPGLEDNANYL